MSEVIAPLRARVRLESPARTDDNLGGAAISWTNEGSVWAEVSTIGSARSEAFDAAPSVASFRVEMRARSDVRAGWRVVWGARVLSIVGVRNDGGARIELACEEEKL